MGEAGRLLALSVRWMVGGARQRWWRKAGAPGASSVPNLVAQCGDGVGLDSLALDLLLASCLATGRSLNLPGPQFPNVKGGDE